MVDLAASGGERAGMAEAMGWREGVTAAGARALGWAGDETVSPSPADPGHALFPFGARGRRGFEPFRADPAPARLPFFMPGAHSACEETPRGRFSLPMAVALGAGRSPPAARRRV